MPLPLLADKNKSRLSFEELRLSVAEPVKVEIRSPNLRLTVTYAGHYFQQAVLLGLTAKSQRLQSLPAGTLVTVRFIAANKACAFSSRIQKSQQSPYPLLFIDYPESVEAVQIRKTPRVRARILVSLDEGEPNSLGGGWPKRGLCSDISLHGARLEATDLLGDVGQGLLMTARMQVGLVDQMLLAPVIIRNVEDYEDPQTGEYRVIHGVEFTELDEESQLVLSGFVYQQMLKEQGAL